MNNNATNKNTKFIEVKVKDIEYLFEFAKNIDINKYAQILNHKQKQPKNE